MKFGQLIESNNKMFFFKNHAKKKAERLVPDLFPFCKKALHEVKATGLELSFSIFIFQYKNKLHIKL